MNVGSRCLELFELRAAIIVGMHVLSIAACVFLARSSIGSIIASICWALSFVMVMITFWGRRFVKVLSVVSFVLAARAVIGALLAWSCSANGIRGCL